MATPAEPSPARTLSLLLRDTPDLTPHHLRQAHAQLFRRHLHHHPVLLTQLLTLSSSSSPSYAARLFSSVPSPDLVLCNAMLNSLSLSSPLSALSFFSDHVLRRGLSPDRYTFAAAFKAAASVPGVAAVGAQLHALLAKSGAPAADVFALNALLDMYLKAGRPDLAARLAPAIPAPNAITGNILLSSLVNARDLTAALKLFDEMPSKDIVSWNTMVTAFARAGDVVRARDMFEEMPERNVASWNAMISGLTRNARPEEALAVFSEMVRAGMRPDGMTMTSLLAAACEVDDVADDVVRLAWGMRGESVSVSTGLVHLLGKRGEVEEARRVFDEMPERDLAAWNAMIGAYAKNRRPDEAIELFKGMNCEPDGITMVGLLNACSQTGAIELAKWADSMISRYKITRDVHLDTALVDMYAKCGDLDRARRVFDEMPYKDLASWNAMIGGMAAHGRGREAVSALETMERSGISPNEITFIGVLSACGHGGLADKGLELFELMRTKYGLVPRIEHYGCIVDLLARVGRLAEARDVIHNTAIDPDAAMWGALLAGSVLHKNVGLAEEAAREIERLDPRHDGNYVMLSNAYASAGRWGEVEKVREKMRASHVKKIPGWSSVEAAGRVHWFRSGDRAHDRCDEIYRAWDELVKVIRPLGYEPDTSSLLRNLDKEEDKEEALFRHSEKLALSFALICSEKGDSLPIRIVKNLRICGDCHRAMELVSEVTRRDIIIRDRRRFHHFSHGRCSCGGFW